MPAKKTPVGPASDDVFEHETPYGTLRLPSLSQVNARAMQRALQLEGLDQVFAILESATADDTDAQGIIDRLSMADMELLNDAWAAHSGVSVGESSAS